MHLIPPHSILHYKCAFDVETFDQEGMTRLRKIILNWCILKYSHKDLFLQPWFFKGDKEQHKIKNVFIRTACNYGIYNSNNPEHWSFELIHSDDELKYRFWSTEIGLSRITTTKLRFVLILKHWINPGYIGEAPKPPYRTVPKIVTSILSSDNCECTKNGIPLLSDICPLNLGDGKKLQQMLFNEKRIFPIIIFPYNEEETISHRKLQIKVMGNCNVYVCCSKDVEDEIIYLTNFDKLHKKYNFKNTLFRIYFPKLNFKIPNDSQRHRFFLKE